MSYETSHKTRVNGLEDLFVLRYSRPNYYPIPPTGFLSQAPTLPSYPVAREQEYINTRPVNTTSSGPPEIPSRPNEISRFLGHELGRRDSRDSLDGSSASAYTRLYASHQQISQAGSSQNDNEDQIEEMQREAARRRQLNTESARRYSYKSLTMLGLESEGKM
jgi:hypothetical protein